MTKPVAPEKNQCDGCALGLPVDENGNHLREGAVFGIHQSCTKHKYGKPAPEPSSKDDACTRCGSPREYWQDAATLDGDSPEELKNYCGLCGALLCDKMTVSDDPPLRCYLWWGHKEAGQLTHRIGEWSTSSKPCDCISPAFCMKNQGTLQDGFTCMLERSKPVAPALPESEPTKCHEYVRTPTSPGNPVKAVLWDGTNLDEVRKVYPGLGEEYMRDKGCRVGDYVVSEREGMVRFYSATVFHANWIAPAATAEREFHFEDAQVMEALVGTDHLRDRVKQKLNFMTSGEKWSLYRAIVKLAATTASRKLTQVLSTIRGLETRVEFMAKDELAAINAKLDAQEEAGRALSDLTRAQEQIAQLTEFWDCAMSQSVGLRYNYETKVVTNERAESAEQQIAALQGRIEKVILLLDNYRDFGNNHAWEHPQILRDKIRNILTTSIAPEKPPTNR